CRDCDGRVLQVFGALARGDDDFFERRICGFGGEDGWCGGQQADGHGRRETSRTCAHVHPPSSCRIELCCFARRCATAYRPPEHSTHNRYEASLGKRDTNSPSAWRRRASSG